MNIDAINKDKPIVILYKEKRERDLLKDFGLTKELSSHHMLRTICPVRLNKNL
jgi:hypothetical protein